jgi:hypothetical protein
LKRFMIIRVMSIVCVLVAFAPWIAASEPGFVFPDFDGWNKKGAPTLYSPENLYEYIDGAAEVFLSYDFQSLGSLTYENDKKASFSVDIYRHGSERNGFGIYSQERPRSGGNFLPIGAQGYYETGVLNFLKGVYYVKLSGYDLGDKDKDVLTAAADVVAKAIEGSTRFPGVLACFPQQGKLSGSEKYIAQNFLGHSFLHSAFIADYEMNGQKFQVFIIETDDPKGAGEITQKYRDFVAKKGLPVTTKGDGNMFRFEDPYYKSNGQMNVEVKGNYCWGLFSKDDAAAESIIKQIEKNLEQNKLI